MSSFVKTKKQISGTCRMTDNEFYKAVAVWANIKDPNTAKRYIDSIAEIIIRQIYYDGECKFPRLGTFKLKTVKGSTQVAMEDGEQVIYNIPEHYVPVFTPTDGFIDDVNETIVSKGGRRRARENRISEADKKRIARQIAREKVDSMSDEKRKQAEYDITEMINKYAQNYQKRNRKETPADE